MIRKFNSLTIEHLPNGRLSFSYEIGSCPTEGYYDLYQALVKAEDEAHQLKLELKAKQAKIDSLMMEYEPEQISPEQWKEWEEHQQLTGDLNGPTIGS